MSAVIDLVAVFGAGVASAGSPCVAPLIPAYLGMLSTPTELSSTCVAPDIATTPAATRSGLVLDTLVFVLGFSLVFSVLGAVAGLAGSWVDASRSIIERVGGVLLVALGLLAASTTSARGPVRLGAQWRPLDTLGMSTVPARLRPLAIGVAFGAAWTPCVGPLLASALLAAGHRSSAAGGSATLFVFALGVGVPFVVMSALASLLPRRRVRWPRAGVALHRLSAVVLVVLGALLIADRSQWLSNRSAQLIDAVI